VKNVKVIEALNVIGEILEKLKYYKIKDESDLLNEQDLNCIVAHFEIIEEVLEGILKEIKAGNK